MPRLSSRASWLFLAGAILMAAAALSTNTSVEQAFGRAPQTLAWGPRLFRILLALHGGLLVCASFLVRPRQSVAGSNILSRRSWVVLGSLTTLAVVLRIPGLNSCMWLDEVLTMAHFARPPATQILTSFPDQNQHMLYSLLAHASMRVFGEQVWALRLPSVVFGIASIWALFLVGRRLIGENEALLACALMTVSYHHIWFSENARGYMGLLFFTNLSTWLWLEAMDRDTWRGWMGYAVTIVLGMWIHMTMLFVVAAHAIIFLVVWIRSGREPARLSRAMAAFVLCGTLSLQVYALALPEFIRTAASEVSPPSEWTNPLWVITEGLRSLRVGFAGAAVVFCGGLLVAAGWFDIFRREQRAAWAMVLPAVMGGGSMLMLGHNLWPRFFFFCMGFGLLIVVHGAMQLPRLLALRFSLPVGWARAAGYAVAGLIIVASITTIPRCYALPKQDFTGARDFIQQRRAPGEPVIVVGLAAHAYSQYYAPEWPVAATASELATLRQNGARAFLVYTLPIELKAAHPDIWKTVEADFETVKIFPGTLGGGQVYVCRDRTPAHAELR